MVSQVPTISWWQRWPENLARVTAAPGGRPTRADGWPTARDCGRCRRATGSHRRCAIWSSPFSSDRADMMGAPCAQSRERSDTAGTTAVAITHHGRRSMTRHVLEDYVACDGALRTCAGIAAELCWNGWFRLASLPPSCWQRRSVAGTHTRHHVEGELRADSERRSYWVRDLRSPRAAGGRGAAAEGDEDPPSEHGKPAWAPTPRRLSCATSRSELDTASSSASPGIQRQEHFIQHMNGLAHLRGRVLLDGQDLAGQAARRPAAARWGSCSASRVPAVRRHRARGRGVRPQTGLPADGGGRTPRPRARAAANSWH